MKFQFAIWTMLSLAGILSYPVKTSAQTNETQQPPYSIETNFLGDTYNVKMSVNHFDRFLNDSISNNYYVSIPGLPSTMFDGVPALPYKIIKFATPDYSNVYINIVDSAYVDYNIDIANVELSDQQLEQEGLTRAESNVVYTGFMPELSADITNTQIYREVPIHTLTIMPMKYDVENKILRVFTYLDIECQLSSIESYAESEEKSPSFKALTKEKIKSMLYDDAAFLGNEADNNDIAPQLDLVESSEYQDLYDKTEDMLIVSYGDFREATDKLKEWKKNLGYRVHVVEDWNWTIEKVDSVIKYYYNTKPNLTTVIIMGTHLIVPGHSVFKYFQQYLSKDVRECGDAPFDLPYMCLDEVDDNMPDVVYGRICAYCTAQSLSAVDKIIKYEKGLFRDESSFNRVFLSGRYYSEHYFPEDPKTKPSFDRFIPTLEECRNILQSNDISAQRIYVADDSISPMVWYHDYRNGRGYIENPTPIPDELLKPNFKWNGTEQDIINAFNEGVNLAIYNGHGSVNGWSAFGFDIFSTECFAFQTSCPLAFSICCFPGNHMKYNNCLSAVFSREYPGPIADIASSHASWLGYSDGLLLGMVDAIWPNSYSYNGWADPIKHKAVYRLYDILQRGLYRAEETQGGGYWDVNSKSSPSLMMQRATFHVFGDPTINYYRDCPQEYTTIFTYAKGTILNLSIDETELPAKAVLKNLTDGTFVTHHLDENSRPSEYTFHFDKEKEYELVVSGPTKIPFFKKIIGAQIEDPVIKPFIKLENVSYDASTQQAIVRFLNNTGKQYAVSFVVSDIYGNTHIVPTLLTLDKNVRILDLTGIPSGMIMITLMANNMACDTYKLLKN